MKRVLLGYVCIALVSSMAFAAEKGSIQAQDIKPEILAVNSPAAAPDTTVTGVAETSGEAATSSSASGATPTSTPPSGSAPASHPNSDPNIEFVNKQQLKVMAEREIQQKRAEREQAFKLKDKKLINSILDRIMSIIESKHDGVAKVRVAAILLQELLNIHFNSELEVGSDKKLEALSKLSDQVNADRDIQKSIPKYKYVGKEIAGEYEFNNKDVEKAIEALNKDKFDKRITSLLKDYFGLTDELGTHEKGKMSLYGVQVGAGATLVGGEVGAYFGKMVGATGRRYLEGCVAGSFSPGVGVYFAPGHISGDTKVGIQNVELSADHPGKLDVFLAANSESSESSPGSSIKLKETVLAIPGARLGSWAFLRPMRCPIAFGRDYKALRQRLGLVANPGNGTPSRPEAETTAETIVAE